MFRAWTFHQGTRDSVEAAYTPDQQLHHSLHRSCICNVSRNCLLGSTSNLVHSSPEASAGGGPVEAAYTPDSQLVPAGQQYLVLQQHRCTCIQSLYINRYICSNKPVLSEGKGQALADRYQAFKIHHLGRQSLYIHWLIIDITTFKCLSLYCMSIAVISVK
jgi:hypothetical protein